MIYLVDYSNQGHRQTYGEIYEKNIADSKYIILDSFIRYFKILFTKNNVYFLTGDDNFIRTFFIGLCRSILNKKTFMNYYHLDFYFKKDIKSKIKKFLINRQYKNITSFHFNEFKIDDLKGSNFTYISEFFFGFDFKEKVKSDKYTFFYGGAISKRKGFEQLIEAFYNFSLNNKNFLLKIVGKIDSKEYLNNEKYISLIEQNHILHINKRLDDKDFDKEIYTSDCVVIPYEKSFKSNSGILAKAIFYNKQILASNHGYIGDFLNLYQIGFKFDIDEIEEFLIAIEQSIGTDISIDKYEELKNKHNINNVFHKIQNIQKGKN